MQLSSWPHVMNQYFNIIKLILTPLSISVLKGIRSHFYMGAALTQVALVEWLLNRENHQNTNESWI